eukprot:987364-Pyramimonas_sp.AAC.2
MRFDLDSGRSFLFVSLRSRRLLKMFGMRARTSPHLLRGVLPTARAQGRSSDFDMLSREARLAPWIEH